MTTPPFRPRLIGMVHLLPLPGAPGYRGSIDEIAACAASDARILADAGFDAVLVENYGDAPFRKERVEPARLREKHGEAFLEAIASG